MRRMISRASLAEDFICDSLLGGGQRKCLSRREVYGSDEPFEERRTGFCLPVPVIATGRQSNQFCGEITDSGLENSVKTPLRAPDAFRGERPEYYCSPLRRSLFVGL
jgi:hypothetical protein